MVLTSYFVMRSKQTSEDNRRNMYSAFHQTKDLNL